MRHYYYTICSKDCLYKSLVLYESMKEKDGDFKFFVVCMDQDTYDMIRQLNTINMVPIDVSGMKSCKELIIPFVQENSEPKYSISAKAIAALYLMESYSFIDHLVWVNCQLAFMNDPAPIFNQWDKASTLLLAVQHGNLKDASTIIDIFMGFKKDSAGIRFLQDLLERGIGFSNADNMLQLEDHFVYGNAVKNIDYSAFFPNSDSCSNCIAFNYEGFHYNDGNGIELNAGTDDLHLNLPKAVYLPYINKCTEAMNRILRLQPHFYSQNSPVKTKINNYFNFRFNTNPTEYSFCSICSRENLLQTLALHQSLKKQKLRFTLWICCMDDLCYEFINRSSTPELIPVNLANLQLDDKSINNLCYIKYHFIRYIIKNNYGIDRLLYLDSGYYFFQNPKPMLDKMKLGSIFIFHNLSEGVNSPIYSMIGFKRDRNSIQCIEYWRQKLYNTVATEGRHLLTTEAEVFKHWSALFKGVSRINLEGIVGEYSKDCSKQIFAVKKKAYAGKNLLLAYRFDSSMLKGNSIKGIINKLYSFPLYSQKEAYLPYLKLIKGYMQTIKL